MDYAYYQHPRFSVPFSSHPDRARVGLRIEEIDYSKALDIAERYANRDYEEEELLLILLAFMTIRRN